MTQHGHNHREIAMIASTYLPKVIHRFRAPLRFQVGGVWWVGGDGWWVVGGVW